MNLLSFLQLSNVRLNPEGTNGNGGFGVYVSSNSRINLCAVSAGGSCLREGRESIVRMFRIILDRNDGTRKDKGDKTVLNSRKRIVNGVNKKGTRYAGVVEAVVSTRSTACSERLGGLAEIKDSYCKFVVSLEVGGGTDCAALASARGSVTGSPSKNLAIAI